ncbi:MAG: cell division protein FtsL [Elusimicrobiaceae bacterium]|nr:cell division protein FtsL [Elusimicrobiaceae bacterium]
MRVFIIVFISAIFAFGVVMMRVEIHRAGRSIGKLQNEVQVKEARNQYLELENARLSSPLIVSEIAQEQLKLRRTPPQNVVVLEN